MQNVLVRDFPDGFKKKLKDNLRISDDLLQFNIF